MSPSSKARQNAAEEVVAVRTALLGTLVLDTDACTRDAVLQDLAANPNARR
jgi:hypothetical protein